MPIFIVTTQARWLMIINNELIELELDDFIKVVYHIHIFFLSIVSRRCKSIGVKDQTGM